MYKEYSTLNLHSDVNNNISAHAQKTYNVVFTKLLHTTVLQYNVLCKIGHMSPYKNRKQDTLYESIQHSIPANYAVMHTT